MGHPAFSFDLDLTELEFLEREFNLTLTSIEPVVEELIESPHVILAACRVHKLENFFKRCKDDSVILFLFGNETYDVKTYEFLNQYSSKIRLAFVYNMPSFSSISQYLSTFFGFVYDLGPNVSRYKHFFYRLTKNGIDLMMRTRNITLNFPALDFPQGYSKRFVQELKLKDHIIGQESLMKNILSPNALRPNLISFVGQKGSWYRQFVLEITRNCIQDFAPRFTDGWGGSNQGLSTMYLDNLSNSRFTLHPPGNLTNKTHRYLESLLMGTLPILPPATIQDPHRWGVWSEEFNVYSWRKLLKQMQNMNEETRIKLVDSALNLEIHKLEYLKLRLGEVVPLS